MRKRKFSKSQRLEILAKWDAGSSVDDLSREYQELLAPVQINQGWAMDFVSDL